MSDPSPIVLALRDALPTRVHAEMLFEQAADLLGASGWVENWAGGTRRVLFRRDPSGDVVPWPVVTLRLVGSEDFEIEGAGEAPPRPERYGRAPNLHGLGPGDIQIHDGKESYSIRYDDDGRYFETSAPHSRDLLAGIPAALARRTAQPLEILSEVLAGLDPGRHGPARLAVPKPFPCGITDLWNKGLRALRQAVFDGSVPAGTACAVADGLTGDAVAWGASREEALVAWRVRVADVRPWPSRTEAAPGIPGEEAWKEKAPTGLDAPMPKRVPENIPAAILRLETPPAPSIPGDWKRLLADNGAVVPVLARPDPNGFTLIGDRAAAAIPPGEIDGRLARAGAASRRAFPQRHEYPEELPPKACTVTTYRLVDEATGKPIEPERETEAQSPEFQIAGVNGERLRWGALRLRWEKP
ncbi:MAG: hypothetical protein FD180_381 [Planctomycetota bacterium]|nr:MAG: hypothetical protein FD180_381 [Planctomycetota bacterium]